MIHNDIQNQLQLLIKTSAPPLIEVADHAVETPQWTPGQQIPAHVLASLPNGRFQVQVGDQILDLNLPRNTQPGESLELTYVSNTPRLTFALLKDLPALPPMPASTPVTISGTASFIRDLLQPESAPQAALAQSAKAAAPQVLKAPPADIPAFAQALRSSVSQSGLFYESHQAQWLNGELNLAALRQEPQGQLLPLPQPAEPQVAVKQQGPGVQTAAMPQVVAERQGARPAENLPASQPQPLPLSSSPLRPETLKQPYEQAPAVDHPGAAVVGERVHPQTVPLIQQQLHTLDARQIVWQGEVWPGQQMHWEIEEELEHRGGQQETEQPSWHTRLNLQLPVLGGVTAKLAFVNGLMQLDIAAESQLSVVLMRKRQGELAEGFAASGLHLSGVTIQHG